MKYAVIVCAFLAGSSAFAQTTSDPCNVPAGTQIPSGCFPLTYKPADGGPERPVFLSFKPGPDLAPVGANLPTSRGGAVAGAEKSRELDIGIDASYNKTDYGTYGNILTGAFVTFMGKRFGGEANVSYTAAHRVEVSENTFTVGPRYNVVNSRHIVGYVKASFGAGHFHGDPGNPAANGHNFFVQSYGGGVDVHVSRHFNIRAFDGEYQMWSSFPPSGTLSPYTLTSGVSFRL
jgi:hypothetical protein